jgi:hypothetical protein
MQIIKFIFLLSLILISFKLPAQTLNWASLKPEQKHIINAGFGLEYGMVYNLGYGFQLPLKFPIVLNAEFSMPSGGSLFDDFKSKVGAQMKVVSYQNFAFTARASGIFRRFENSLSRLLNFGSDFAGTIGYYRSKWFVAGEIGFDKAIITHFKPTDLYMQSFPEAQNGWYEPTSGGNLYYGLQVGFSIKDHHDIFLKAGKIINQDFATTPLVPMYFQLGYNFKI